MSEMQQLNAVCLPRKIQRIYDLIPTIKCQRCGQCCGPVEAAPIEKKIIREYCENHKIDMKDFFASILWRTVKAILGD